MTEADVRLALMAAINKTKGGTQKAFADLHGLTPGYVGDVVNGRRKPGPGILDALDLEVAGTVTTYRRKRK